MSQNDRTGVFGHAKERVHFESNIPGKLARRNPPIEAQMNIAESRFTRFQGDLASSVDRSSSDGNMNRRLFVDLDRGVTCEVVASWIDGQGDLNRNRLGWL